MVFYVDADGEIHERIYDVLLSGDRKPGADGTISAVGSSVDMATATY